MTQEWWNWSVIAWHPRQIVDLDKDQQWTLMSHKANQPDMGLPAEEQKPVSSCSCPTHTHTPKSDWASRSHLPGVQRTEKCVERHRRKTIRNMQIVGHFTGQTTWFFQQINCKEIKKESERDGRGKHRSGLRDKTHICKHDIWTLFGTWCKQTVKKL